MYAYQLAVVVDDAFQGVTQVVRGSDLLDSAPRQLWLQKELGQLKECFTAPQLVGRLALAAGLIPEYAPITPAQLLPYFSWDKLPRRDFVFEL